MWQGWINGILGLWVIVSAFVVAGSKTGNMANDLIAGIVLLVLGLWAGANHKSWQEWVIAIVGAWMIFAGIWFPSSYGGNMANDLIAGIIVAIAGFWSVLASAPGPRKVQQG
ncbi:MAG: SPW repeat protein [Deltaproteobacteria bacterium]|nr:SPW repeat protein [Deltaproteobacteria bacterium]MBW2021241.1 SPW repeat protein [Deltaproteobacteria bacterium]MBW2152276.1 SPW repeat protein [Deltaproteobacteria bacterium]